MGLIERLYSRLPGPALGLNDRLNSALLEQNRTLWAGANEKYPVVADAVTAAIADGATIADPWVVFALVDADWTGYSHDQGVIVIPLAGIDRTVEVGPNGWCTTVAQAIAAAVEGGASAQDPTTGILSEGVDRDFVDNPALHLEDRASGHNRLWPNSLHESAPKLALPPRLVPFPAAVALRFDDGPAVINDATITGAAYQIAGANVSLATYMAKFGIPGTVFALTQEVGSDDDTWLNWDDIQDLAYKGGWEVGGHGRNSTYVGPTIPDEVLGSKLDIETALLKSADAVRTVAIDNVGGYGIGATILHLDGLASTFYRGWWLLIGANKYLITDVGSYAGGEQDVTIAPPGLVVAVANDDSVVCTFDQGLVARSYYWHGGTGWELPNTWLELTQESMELVRQNFETGHGLVGQTGTWMGGSPGQVSRYMNAGNLVSFTAIIAVAPDAATSVARFLTACSTPGMKAVINIEGATFNSGNAAYHAALKVLLDAIVVLRDAGKLTVLTIADLHNCHLAPPVYAADSTLLLPRMGGLPNGDFEALSDGALNDAGDTTAYTWRGFYTTNTGAGTLEIVGVDGAPYELNPLHAYPCAKAIHMKGQAASAYPKVGWWTQVEPGRSYTMAWDALRVAGDTAAGPTLQICVVFRGGAASMGAKYWLNSLYTPTRADLLPVDGDTGDWHRYHYSFYVPSWCNKVELSLELRSGVSYELLIDNVELF